MSMCQVLGVALFVACASCTTDGWTYRAFPDATGSPDTSDASDGGDEGALDVPEAGDTAVANDAEAGVPTSLRLSGGVASAGSSASGSLRLSGGFEGAPRQCAGVLCVTGSIAP